jgi:hypothetical protein
VLANHAGCAAFGPENEYTKRRFIRKLLRATIQADKLSVEGHKSINIEKKVHVEIHGT